MLEYVDTSEYSDDGRYRWWYERRWADGPSLCWVGLNPSTGDTSGRPRPTLRKVVDRARGVGLAAVVVVNLFSWRATQPRDLKLAALDEDIVGDRTDDTIVQFSERAGLTLVAWGAHGALLDRGRDVTRLIRDPMCLGTTARGEPRHPLYVPGTVPLRPYERR